MHPVKFVGRVEKRRRVGLNGRSFEVGGCMDPRRTEIVGFKVFQGDDRNSLWMFVVRD